MRDIFLTLLGILGGGLIAWFYFKKSPTKQGQEIIRDQLDAAADGQELQGKKIDEIYNAIIKKPDVWYEVDISAYVPPAIARAAKIIFISDTGILKGYVRAKGGNEQHFFNTSINNKIPIGLEITNAKIEFQTVGALPEGMRLIILCPGFLLKE